MKFNTISETEIIFLITSVTVLNAKREHTYEIIKILNFKYIKNNKFKSKNNTQQQQQKQQNPKRSLANLVV